MVPVLLNQKPDILLNEAEEFLKENWAFDEEIRVKELVSYDSRTYLVESSSRFIYKISNSVESRDERYFECLSEILFFLELHNIEAQRLIRSSNGKCILNFNEKRNKPKNDDENVPLKTFLLSYIYGELICDIAINEELCRSLGSQLWTLTNCVDQISSKLVYLKEYSKDSVWNIRNAINIKHFIPYFECEHKRSLLKLALEDFEQKVLPFYDSLTQGFIHGDPNEMNILIDEKKNIYFIDWQDCTMSFKIYDLAILIFSLMGVVSESKENWDSFSIGKYCLVGYLCKDPSALNQIDINVLPIVVQTRIAMSLCIGYYTYKCLDPSNEYVLRTQKWGWRLLEDLLNNQEEYCKRWIL